METASAIVYYTCLNNRCPKHRGIFVDGDPEHADCERTRLYLEGESPWPRRVSIFVPALLALAAATVAVLVMRRTARKRQTMPPQTPKDAEELDRSSTSFS